METKKSPKANLENKKSVFRQIGMILALAVVFLAFQWKTYDKTIKDFDPRTGIDVPIEMVPPSDFKTQPPLPPPPQSVLDLRITDNEDEIDGDFKFDAEANGNTAIPEPEIFRQDEETPVIDDVPMRIPQVMPEFPGGEKAMYEFLRANLEYPEGAKAVGIAGTVYLTFIIEKDGSVSHIEILRGIGGGLDEEAIRVVQKMPRWIPGKQGGSPVRVQFNLPLKFTLR